MIDTKHAAINFNPGTAILAAQVTFGNGFTYFQPNFVHSSNHSID